MLTSIVTKNLLLDLILALQNQPAARILPSRTGDRTLASDLAILYSRVDSNQLEIASAIPLVRCMVRNGSDGPTWSDADLWQKVFAFITHTTAASRPTTYEKADVDTPLRSSSASQMGMEQTHDDVDQRILEELTGRVYYDVEGFFERYFDDQAWTAQARDIYEQSRGQYTGGRWMRWPEPSIQGSFFAWFMTFQDTILGDRGRRYHTSANKVLRGSEADRKLDIFLTPANAALPDGEHDWSNVLVVGEHKQNSDQDTSSKTLVQLAGYTRELFGSQPDRRFVPGFTICGSLIRLWIFDRSGAYNSQKFDIHHDPERFVRAIAGYVLMTDAELGLNTFIQHNGTSKYIDAAGARISLEDKPIASTKAIVCRGTTCYRGTQTRPGGGGHCVKFTWPSEKRQREGDLLKLAKERGVKGIAEWFYHEQINIQGHPDTIAHLRRGMKFGTPRKLSSKASWVNGSADSNRAYARTRSLVRSRSSATRLANLGVSTNSAPLSPAGQKRPTEEGLLHESAKRSKSSDSRSGVANARTKVDPQHGEPHPSDYHSIQEADPDSLAGSESETFGNRIHCCLVVSPAGRPLSSYRSVRELLEALRDAIKGHRSLLEDGKILHRDISENNIIITEVTVKGDPTGLLIDLDLAKELNSVPSGASHRTGTMQFMAIEVLQGKGHTYRHDLESFFYVFIWMCIRYGEDASEPSPSRPLEAKRKGRPTTASVLRDWYTGTYTQIARTKVGDMDKNEFENVIVEFAPQFERLRQLARELRSILFPIMDGAIFTGTFRNHDIMYDGIIEAFDRAIRCLGEEV
ncbi:unnamed protein product [Sphagnum balticum]